MPPKPSLFHATAAKGQGASFLAEREGGFALLTPLTSAADEWLRGHVGEEATWASEALVVEMRFFPDLADAIIATGFLFERRALPN